LALRNLNRWHIAAYGLVSLPIGLIGIPMAIYLAPLYAGELGLPLAAVGTMLMLSRVTDFITDPITGIISDRWRPKIGRRKVWLPIGTLTMTTGVFFLFRPGDEASILYFLLAVSLVYLGYTTLQLPYNAWGAELSPDYHVRTRITASAKFFDTTGLVIATIIPAVVLSKAGSSAGDIMDALSLFFIFSLPICAAIAFTFVPEPEHHVANSKFEPGKVITLMAGNKSFALVTVAVFAATVAEVFRQTVTVFFATQVLGVENIGIVYVFYFAVALTMIPVWGWIAGRIQKHRALIVALLIIFASNIGMYFLQYGQTTMFTILAMIKGACYGALALLPGAMIADCADVDTAHSGEQRQGLFFAVNAMVQKLGFALGQGVPLILLSLVGFDAAGQNGPDELFWLSVLYSMPTALIVLVAILALLPYSLTAERHTELRAYLGLRESGEEAELPDFLKP
jgi:Na+/melibiose symporter-like transporter